MNQTRSIFGDPGRIAPSVAKSWRDDFIVELRLLSVPGDEIGDALMTVETHVAESGESAVQAFGEASAYAREIAVATRPAGRGWAVGPATVVSSALGLMGMLVTVRAFSAWLDGGPVGVTTGELVGVGLVLALVSALFFPTTLRLIVGHPWRAALLPALLIGVLVGIIFLLSEPLLTVPTAPLAVVGILLLVVGSAVNWADGRDDMDEIVAPGQAPRGRMSGRLLAALVMPLMTVLLLVQAWILYAITM